MADGKQSNYFVHTLLRARDWQHRPQFDEVCDWWKSRGRGVCALVGMGGAGKTAIAERFLNVEVQPLGCQDPEKQAEAWTPIKSLPSPHSVFVYSFYDDDKPENFFRDLQIWLEGTSTPDKQKSPMQLMFDIQQHQGLIVLDGLERVQESGARGGFGRLTSPSLRDLLNHIACGAAREMSVLVTSRFPLTDLRDSQPRFFHSIAVDQIDLAAGVSLLRERGVRGTNMQLAPIVEHCGRHALTVDLAGGYIKEYGHGDPSTPLNLGTVEELQAEAEQEPDDDKRDVLIQSKRFARIAQRYREAMLDSDEAALALLERICLFRLGVDCDTLAAIFTGPAAERVSNKALANLNAAELQKKLDWLVKMRVVEKGMHPTKNDFYIYSVHPAVRDGFLVGLEVQTVRTSHDAVSRVLSVSLGARPRGKLVIQDNAKLDLVEELIHHTLLAGRTSEAWDIHWCVADELRVWQDFGTFERGLRICRDFLRTCPNDRQMVPGLSAACHAALIHATGICLSQLGRVAESREYFKRFVECGACNHGLSGIYNLAYGFVCTGHLRDAHELMDNGREMVRDSEDPADEGSFVSLLASINGLRGRLE